MNALTTIRRADSPTARCKHCGVHRQFHGMSATPTNAYDRPRDHAFEAETADDLDPADLSNRDLIVHCGALAAAAEGATDEERDGLTDRRDACRAEIDARIKAVFGVGFEDVRGAMGW